MPEIVTIGEFPDTSWLVVTGNILLVMHSAINYQVYARLTLEVRRCRRSTYSGNQHHRQAADTGHQMYVLRSRLQAYTSRAALLQFDLQKHCVLCRR